MSIQRNRFSDAAIGIGVAFISFAIWFGVMRFLMRAAMEWEWLMNQHDAVHAVAFLVIGFGTTAIAIVAATKYIDSFK